MTAFELVGKKGVWKSLELQRAGGGEVLLEAKECFTLPLAAYTVYAKYDDFLFLPWQRNLPLKKGRRCVAAVSRPWLARGKSYRAEIRFPRSCGAWLSEPDVVVEEEGNEVGETAVVFCVLFTNVASSICFDLAEQRLREWRCGPRAATERCWAACCRKSC